MSLRMAVSCGLALLPARPAIADYRPAPVDGRKEARDAAQVREARREMRQRDWVVRRAAALAQTLEDNPGLLDPPAVADDQ